MERNEIIKALECCLTCDCIICNYSDSANFICRDAMMKDAISLIKELTEENERLKDEKVVALRRTIENAKAEARANTVRQMQERLTTFFTNDDNLEYNEVDADYVNEKVDQIAEEMLKDGL